MSSPSRALAVLVAALTALTALAVGGAGGVHAAGAAGQTATGTDADGVPQYRLAPGAAPDPVRPAQVAHRADYTVAIGGRDRVFRLVVPPGLQGRRVPLVLGLHALYSDRRRAEALMGWERLAATGRFVVVYPQGTSASWNAGRCCGGAVREGVDDVTALVEMARLAGLAHPVDPQRRYVTGFSNGAMMALSLACARPDVVAGVVAVAGAHMDPCRPARSVPVLQVHGTADDTVPYDGTAHSAFVGTRIPSVRDTQSLWRGAGSATSRAPVEVRRVEGGGHVWPGDATSRGWAFLRAQASRCVPADRARATPWRARCG